MPIILALVIGSVFIKQWPQLVKVFEEVNIWWVIGGLCSYFINYCLRGCRIKTISNVNLHLFPDAVHVACLHGLITYLLPLRTGDLSLPVILKSVAKIDIRAGSKILLTIRMLDISILGFLTLLAAIFSHVVIGFFVKILWISIGLGMIFAPAVLKCFSKYGQLLRISFVTKISKFGNLRPIGLKEIFQTFGIWFAVGCSLFCTVRAIGLPLNPLDIWFIVTIQLPMQLMPVQGIANSGNHEGGWIAALLLLGYTASEGLKIALASHTILLFYVILLSPIIWLTKKEK